RIFSLISRTCSEMIPMMVGRALLASAPISRPINRDTERISFQMRLWSLYPMILLSLRGSRRKTPLCATESAASNTSMRPKR
ncbi:hypothetical protein PMAYCL1PPCAC_06054, partial [Pristionchus mayeri]